jgi:hypothetical protein
MQSILQVYELKASISRHKLAARQTNCGNLPPLSEENGTGQARQAGPAMVELGGEGCA